MRIGCTLAYRTTVARSDMAVINVPGIGNVQVPLGHDPAELYARLSATVAKQVSLRANMVNADVKISQVTGRKIVNVRNPVVLKVVPVPPKILVPPLMIGPTTIVPRAITRSGIAGGVNGGTLAPQTILDTLFQLQGVLSLIWQGRVLGRMLFASAESGGLSRVGQRFDSGFRFQVDTQKGEGRGRHVNVRGKDGSTPGDQHDAYDSPSEWWEFWKKWFNSPPF